MTNGSGPTQPPGPRPHILSGVAEQSARIVRLPDALADVGRAQRLQGEVVQQNKDGTLRINTPQGEMDVQVRGRQPQPGQMLEVDVPAGRPPRQVTIRMAPQPQQPADTPAQNRPPPQSPATPQPVGPIATRPAAPSPSPAPASPAQPPAPQGQPPVQNAPAPRPGVQPQPLPTPAPPPQPAAQQPAPLPPNTAVRLLPVTPAQAQQIVQAASLSITTLPTQVIRTAFAANLIAQGAQNANSQALLQTRPADLGAMTIQPARNLPVASLQPGAVTPIAQNTNLLRQILNLPLNPPPSSPAMTTQGPTPATLTLSAGVVPMPNGTPPIATLIPFTPGMENALAATSSFAKITQLDVRVLNIQPPGVTLTAPPEVGKAQGLPVPGALKITPPTIMPQTPAGTITAQVTGFTPQNLPLVTLQWPGSALPQSFVLQFNAANLPLGSQITLQPQNVMIAQPGARSTAGALPGFASSLPGLNGLFGPGPWPVMDETYQTLLQVSPQAAQALSRILPNPANSGQLGSAALLFIAAARSGDIGSWLGDKKIDALQRAGRNNLLGRLTQELSTLAQRTADAAPATGEWRPIPLPLFWEGEIQKIALFVKQDGGGREDDKDNGKQTRFIFDLDLNRMGGVQLDGLVRDKRFDLVVRTQVPLSVAMQQAMRNSYSQALQSTELHGDLSFQGDIRNWVNVLQKDAAFGASA